MKNITVLIVAAFLTVLGRAEEKVSAKMPAELHLANGVLLRNVSALRWEADRVVLKHAGGTEGIFFRHIAEPDRTAVLAARTAAQARATVPAPAAAVAKDKTFSGQVFVATQGGKNFKLGAVKVMAFERKASAQFETNANTAALPKPLATTVTDGDGRFTLSVPADTPVFIFAEGSRLVGGSVGVENYQWRLEETSIANRDNVLLSNTNLATRRFLVTVSKD